MSKQKRGNKCTGFTFIELMVTIAIVGILVAVALPSYQAHVLKAKRADAKITLENLAAAQELYFFQNNKYTTKFSGIRGVGESVAKIPSENGSYEITLAGTDFSWTMAAAAVDLQVEDNSCARFTLTHLGVQEAFDADGLPSSDCW